jgi:hypothetical protein
LCEGKGYLTHVGIKTQLCGSAFLSQGAHINGSR